MIASIEFWTTFSKAYSIKRGMFIWIFAQIVVKNYMNLVEIVQTAVRGLQKIIRICPQP